MGHDELFQRISVELGLTNAFIGLKMSSNLNNSPDNFTPRPELQGWPARTKITTFNNNESGNLRVLKLSNNTGIRELYFKYVSSMYPINKMARCMFLVSICSYIFFQ